MDLWTEVLHNGVSHHSPIRPSSPPTPPPPPPPPPFLLPALPQWGPAASQSGGPLLSLRDPLSYDGLVRSGVHVICYLLPTLLLSFRRLLCLSWHRLVGLVVKASASRVEDPGFESRLRRDFSGSSHTSDLKIGTPVATMPGAWRYRVSAKTVRPGVSIL